MKLKFLIFLLFISSNIFSTDSEFKNYRELVLAITSNNLEKVKSILKDNSNLIDGISKGLKDSRFPSLAELAVKYFQYDILKYLLENGCATNLDFSDHNSHADLLQLAVNRIYIDGLESEINTKTSTNHKWQCNFVELVNLLLNYCALDKKDSEGKTTFELVLKYKEKNELFYNGSQKDLWYEILLLFEIKKEFVVIEKDEPQRINI